MALVLISLLSGRFVLANWDAITASLLYVWIGEAPVTIE
jgi:hypothetical protein